MRKLILLVLLMSFSASAFAMIYFLTREWYQGSDHMCAYTNGTVLNIGVGVCPLSIQG